MKSPLIAILCTLLLLAGCATTAPAPGTYKKFEKLGRVDVLESFRLSAYQQILVLPVDSVSLPLPSDEHRREPVVKVRDHVTQIFVHEFDGDLPSRFDNKVSVAPVSTPITGQAGALILRLKLTELDPGSATDREIGFGKGAGYIALQGEMIDGGSGRTLVRFRSRVAYKNADYRNFDYAKMLNDGVEEIAGRVANLVRKFS